MLISKRISGDHSTRRLPKSRSLVAAEWPTYTVRSVILVLMIDFGLLHWRILSVRETSAGVIFSVKKHKIRFRILSDLRFQSWIFLRKRTQMSDFNNHRQFKDFCCWVWPLVPHLKFEALTRQHWSPQPYLTEFRNSIRAEHSHFQITMIPDTCSLSLERFLNLSWRPWQFTGRIRPVTQCFFKNRRYFRFSPNLDSEMM